MAAHALSGLQRLKLHRPDKRSAIRRFAGWRLTPYPAYNVSNSVGLISAAPSGTLPDGGSRLIRSTTSQTRRPDKRSAIRRFAGWRLTPYPVCKFSNPVGLISAAPSSIFVKWLTPVACPGLSPGGHPAPSPHRSRQSNAPVYRLRAAVRPARVAAPGLHKSPHYPPPAPAARR